MRLPLLVRCLSLPRLTVLSLALFTSSVIAEDPLLSGKSALGDWTTDQPGVRRRLTLKDLPPPNQKESVENKPKEVRRPEGAWPVAPAGFQVTLFAEGLKKPRLIATAPNGDIFVAESEADRITVLRDADGQGQAKVREIFATKGLKQPFGLAFYPPGPNPQYLYIGNTDAVVRLPYHNGQTKADGEPEKLVDLSSGGRLTGGGHWTRTLAFSPDGKKLYISVGSKSNVDWTAEEEERARIFATDPEGHDKKVFAWGLRNAVGLAVDPESGALWAAVNERDELGDNLVPDYITRVQPEGFYGWPWFYLGPHEDPRRAGEKPELKDKVTVPDILLQSHSAPLCMTFYTGEAFPAEYRGQAFVALHGSWNRSHRTGYKVVRVPVKQGETFGEYIDFLTGFVTSEGDVWGRPVGVTVAKDGSLLVSDDTGGCIWRVAKVAGKK